MLETQSQLTAEISTARSACSVSVDNDNDARPVVARFGGLKRPRVMVLGMRGFPDVQGGVEKHAEKLACALITSGWDVEAIVRNRYVSKTQKSWRGVRLTRIWAPHIKGVETVIHSILGVFYAGISRPEILHIHGIGPAFFTPLARAFGLRVVVTYHSLNYEHKKWGLLARGIFRTGEWAGMHLANGRIAVSNDLAEKMNKAYNVSVSSIPNGLNKPAPVASANSVKKFGLQPNRYALCVARIDEEKRQLDLIEAYARIGMPTFKLALAGDVDHSGRYARSVSEKARQTPGVLLLGYQTGACLAELYANASVFVLPSANEGHPIVVLEAVSYGLPVLLSDIVAHREMDVPSAQYFSVGNIDALEKTLASCLAEPPERLSVRDRDGFLAKYDWNEIAKRTLGVYVSSLPEAKRHVIEQFRSYLIPD